MDVCETTATPRASISFPQNQRMPTLVPPPRKLKTRTNWHWRVVVCAACCLIIITLHADWHINSLRWQDLHMPINSLALPTERIHSKRRVHDICNGVTIPVSPSCPKFLTINYLPSAGIGHQFSEMLFALYAAQYLGLSFTWTPIVSSSDHGDDYASLVTRLGLENLFVNALGARRASTLPREDAKTVTAYASINKTMPLTWRYARGDKDKRNMHLPCNSVLALDAWYHCHGVSKNNCFWAPEHEFLFQRYARCLRAGVRSLGAAFGSCVLLRSDWNKPRGDDRANHTLPPKTVVVVWHIRLGDVNTHKLSDSFYARVIDALAQITKGYRVDIVLIGGGKGRKITDDQVTSLRNTTAAHGLTGSSVDRFWWDDFESQFVAMMQADVLIGSGSSVPQVAALLSGRPLFFNHEPKHGYGFGMEATWDTVDLKADGQVMDSLRRVRLALFSKMETPEDDGDYNPCRTARSRLS